jgi:hypothetical protein
MANGEWLTQLMAGLGGAFTGAGQANERLALEVERQRKAEEERMTRETLASMFERQPTSSQLAMGARVGIPAATLTGIQRMYEPTEQKKEPTMTVGPYMGGQARFKDGVFDSWVIRPKSERDTPTPSDDRLSPSQARTERGRLQGDVEQAQVGFSSLMRQRPRRSEFAGEAPGAYELALKGFQAESTMAAGRRTGAQQRLSAFEQEYGLTPPPAPGGMMVPNAGLQQQIAAEMQRTIQGIMSDPTLSDAEKRQKVQMVNERASQLLRTR